MTSKAKRGNAFYREILMTLDRFNIEHVNSDRIESGRKSTYSGLVVFYTTSYGTFTDVRVCRNAANGHSVLLKSIIAVEQTPSDSLEGIFLVLEDDERISLEKIKQLQMNHKSGNLGAAGSVNFQAREEIVELEMQAELKSELDELIGEEGGIGYHSIFA